jgi:hypothetical protein
MLSRDQHRREAERLASSVSYQRSKSDLRLPADIDPQAAALILARAQVHATLAGITDLDTMASARLEAVRQVLAAHICEGVAHPSRETRRSMRDLATALDEAGVNVDDAVEEHSRVVGYGPRRYSLDGSTYSLDHQWIDGYGVVWEHTGDWAGIGGPTMGTPDISPQLPQQPFNDLVWTRGPLRSAKEAPDREYGLPATPSFDPETKIYAPWGTPQRSFDLAKPLEDNDGVVWRWTGEFDSSEPWLRCEPSDSRLGSTSTLGAIEVFDGPLHQLESDADAESAEAGAR